MNRAREEIKPIVHSIVLETTPQSVFRTITSQTELRKWWAPRVITAKNIVSYEEGKDIEMKLLQQEKNHMVRYSWRPMDWDRSERETTITIEIEDLGASRSQTGEGIQLTVTHDGWNTQDYRNLQDKVWKPAMVCLRELLEGKEPTPWWETTSARSGYRQIKLTVIKGFVERIDKENRGKADKKLASQNIMKLCQNLDGQGKWFIRQTGSEFELRLEAGKILSIQKNGNICIHWRILEELLGKQLREYGNRLALEQDLDIHIGKSQDKVSGNILHVELLTKWYMDIIQYVQNSR